MLKSRSILGPCVVVLLIGAGCQKGSASLVPVEGTLLLKGQPLGKISVTFMPDALGPSATNGPTSMAVTDDNGRFKLMVGTKEGAVAGTHLVVLEDTTRRPPEQGSNEPPPAGRVHWNYQQMSTTPLVVEVPAGGSKDLKLEIVENPPPGSRPKKTGG